MRSRIPRIPAKDLNQLATRIRPVGHTSPGGNPHYYEQCDPDESFRDYDLLHRVARGIAEVTRIETWHIVGSTMGVQQFMPTIAEVIAQIPPKDRERIVAFEVLRPDFPRGIEEPPHVREGGHSYHKAVTILYARGNKP